MGDVPVFQMHLATLGLFFSSCFLVLVSGHFSSFFLVLVSGHFRCACVLPFLLFWPLFPLHVPVRSTRAHIHTLILIHSYTNMFEHTRALLVFAHDHILIHTPRHCH